MLLIFSVAAVDAQKKDTVANPNSPADIQAQFPGGPEKFYDYLRKNLRYPEEAVKNHIEGKVVLQFTVGSGGSIENITVLQGLTPETNAEAARLIYGSANWIPARKNGRYLRSTMTIAISYNLKTK